jgi:hypothetical protein
VSLAAGLAISAVTALMVVLLGLALLPPVRRAPTPTVVTPQTGATGPAALPSAPGAVDAAADGRDDALAAAKVDATGDTGHSGEAASGSDPFQHPGTVAEGTAGSGADAKASEGEGAALGTRTIETREADGETKEDRDPVDCTLGDKEISREAWRRNWPIVCKAAAGEKVAIFIPLKGSLDGETHEVRQRPTREVRINLPAGESLLTMRLYKLRRMGIVDLRVLPWEGKAHGTRLRLKLQPGEVDPVLEIKDGYAKITLDTPATNPE